MTRAAAFYPPEGGLGTSLEQFDGRDCPNGRVPYLVGVSAAQHRAVIFRPGCKMWSCPVCGTKKAWVWSFRANSGAHQLYDNGLPLSFVTLTPHERLSPGQSWWVMPRAWMKLQARLRRQVGHFAYFAVPELHKSRKVHIHMLVTAKVTERWWKDNGRECGFGYQNDKREVHDLGGIIGYVMKYLTKGLSVTDMPKGTRRVRTSRDWPPGEKRSPPPDWSFYPLPKRKSVLEVAGRLEDEGMTVHLLGSRSAWSVIAPDD